MDGGEIGLDSPAPSFYNNLSRHIPALDMYRDMTYDDAVAGIETEIARDNFAKADVSIATFRGNRFVIKDFSRRGFWERNMIGRVVIGREHRAYRALAGIEGLPNQFKRLNPFSLAIEYLEGRDLGGFRRHEIGPGIVLQFERIVNELHERGWVHLDLQRRSNIMLVNGRVFVIDLASAFHPGGVPVIGRLLVRLLGFADRLSLVKVKHLFAPELLTAGERRMIRIRNLFTSRRRRWHQTGERAEKRVRRDPSHGNEDHAGSEHGKTGAGQGPAL